jgi:uncharacterized protein
MISKQDKAKLNNIAKKHKLVLLILFGSRAKGQHREDSDWDLAYLAQRDLTSKKKMDLYSDLEDVAKFNTIDLIDLNATEDALLKKNIFQNSICIHEGQKCLFDKMLTDAIYEYIDYMPLYEIEKNIVKEKLESL